jgi:hypothetical protein
MVAHAQSFEMEVPVQVPTTEEFYSRSRACRAAATSLMRRDLSWPSHDVLSGMPLNRFAFRF